MRAKSPINLTALNAALEGPIFHGTFNGIVGPHQVSPPAAGGQACRTWRIMAIWPVW